MCVCVCVCVSVMCMHASIAFSKCAYAIGPRHISQEIDVKAQQSQRDLRGVEAQLIALLVVGWRRGRDVAKLRVLFQNPQYVSKNKS